MSIDMDQREITGGGFALFETAIGWCGIAWGARGIVGVQLPEAQEQGTRARMQRRHPGLREAAPPLAVQQVIEDIGRLFQGEPTTLAGVTLDMEPVTPFNQRVYDIARTIPPGRTLTYGEIAARLGEPRMSREVGQALGQNPFSIIVPCHRVVAAGGKTGGFSARGGVATKLRMLALEGAPTPQLLPLFDSTL
jgi:methylated-DNA-[protein]-cysteine S-methyltransferase